MSRTSCQHITEAERRRRDALTCAVRLLAGVPVYYQSTVAGVEDACRMSLEHLFAAQSSRCPEPAHLRE